MPLAPAASDLERRKRVRLRLRSDLSITPQKYEGKTYYVVKDPVSLRYYRFKEQEHYLLGFMDGSHTLDEAQKEYEKRFRPERLTLEDLEAFAQQLITAGLAQNESPNAGKLLLDQRKKRKRSQLMQAITNVLYIKIPLYDPDVLLSKMLRYLSFVFSIWFFLLSIAVMVSAVLLVTIHFETFRSKLPSYQEFFSFKTVVYLWIALGIVKVIHEFGHGLSCKTFGGEVHEMGLLFLVFSPCLYCNVSDSWTLPSKWKRIIISAAGIYVELVIAAIATWVWWNTPKDPFINNMSLSLMVVCSVSTVVFNANPLMRYDGYYVLADWIEIPNLRERSNRYLTNLFLEHALGVEVQPEPYMALWRRCLFVGYAIVSYIYRWIITFVILYFLYNWLKPYKLGVLSGMLALAALGSMVGWPLYRLGKNIHKRGRLPDMKPIRVTVTCSIFAALILAAFIIPLPVSRVTAEGIVELEPESWAPVPVPLADNNDHAVLTALYIKDGQRVNKGDVLAKFTNREYERNIATAEQEANASREKKTRLEQASPRNEEEIKRTEQELGRAVENYQVFSDLLRRFGEVKAPRTGIIMSPPSIDDVGKRWDKKQSLCKIGAADDPPQGGRRLRVLIPVTPANYNLLQQDMRAPGQSESLLPVSIRVHGMGRQAWRGRLTTLPQSEAGTIPPLLSNKTGGPVAVKPGTRPEQLIPQTQQYLVAIELVEPDVDMHPGVRAKVKIHCRKRPLSWWVWRSVNDLFNLGLM
ncbi:MAG: biotin/lipoyl-binding protein [Planctomycetes bacterium]|nr:biotin/lipoyl-binding protein [Planctomycetota bacterium]